VHRLGEHEAGLATPHPPLPGVVRAIAAVASTAFRVQGQQVIVAPLGGLPTVKQAKCNSSDGHGYYFYYIFALVLTLGMPRRALSLYNFGKYGDYQ
jgi:hypothetical protein